MQQQYPTAAAGSASTMQQQQQAFVAGGGMAGIDFNAMMNTRFPEHPMQFRTQDHVAPASQELQHPSPSVFQQQQHQQQQAPPTPISQGGSTTGSVDNDSIEDGGANAPSQPIQPSQPHYQYQPQQQPLREKRERIKRIHLPIRDGMNDISGDEAENDGPDWEIPQTKEGETLPPGYDGKRRIKKEYPATDKNPIKPSYYYPTEGSSRGVPVFEPTMEEFRDFNS